MACYWPNKCVENSIFPGELIKGVTVSLKCCLILRLPSFSTTLHNSSITFNRCWSNCYNELVIHFGAILK